MGDYIQNEETGRFEGSEPGGSSSSSSSESGPDYSSQAESTLTWGQTERGFGNEYSNEASANAYLEERGMSGSPGRAEEQAERQSEIEQQKAASNYAGAGAYSSNEYLRGGSPWQEQNVDAQVAAKITPLDEAIAKQAPTDRKSIV